MSGIIILYAILCVLCTKQNEQIWVCPSTSFISEIRRRVSTKVGICGG